MGSIHSLPCDFKLHTPSPHLFPTKSKSVRNWNLSTRIIKLTWIKSNMLLCKDGLLSLGLIYRRCIVPLYLDELLSHGNQRRWRRNDGFMGISELWLLIHFLKLPKLQKYIFVTPAHWLQTCGVFSMFSSMFFSKFLTCDVRKITLLLFWFYLSRFWVTCLWDYMSPSQQKGCRTLFVFSFCRGKRE